MHIVYIHRGVYPEMVGGTYTYIHELGRRLAGRGHLVEIIGSTREAAAGPPQDISGMRVHRYSFRRINPVYSTLQHLSKTYEIYGRIAGERPVDILSVNDSHLGLKTATSALGRRACRIPTFHASLFLEYRLNTAWRIQAEPSSLRRLGMRAIEPVYEHWQRRFETRLLEASEGILVLSDFTRNLIEEYFPTADQGRVKIIPSGVDTDRFQPAENRGALRRELGFDDNSVHLITVRNLSPRMGLENLIEAMARVAASNEGRRANVHLHVCGEGRLRSVLEDRIRELGLADRVSLLGRVTDKSLVRYYQAADLFVLPTTAMEGFGIVTVEALSANLPVVGTPAGATPEILGPIDEDLITRDTSPQAIAEGIERWLARRAKLAGTTRYRDEVLAKYSWERVTDRVEEYYREMSERHRASLAD
ncbi:MAG: glycosyltransferase family 4 protein [Candidatus Eisenbacteria bacterium]